MKSSYTYSVLRYVHDVTTGEFVNVGVALLSPAHQFAGARCRKTYGRLSRVFPGIDGEFFKKLMRSIEQGFDAAHSSFQKEPLLHTPPETVLALAKRILPFDDSSLQWSPMGGGVSDDPPNALNRLYCRLVEAHEETGLWEGRSDSEVWKTYRTALESRQLLGYLKPRKFTVDDDSIEFKHAWKNGIWHCLEPISFDLAQADNIRAKAHRWIGQFLSVRAASEKFKVYMLLGKPQRAELEKCFKHAESILKKTPVPFEIYHEDEAEKLSEVLAQNIQGAESTPS